LQRNDLVLDHLQQLVQIDLLRQQQGKKTTKEMTTKMIETIESRDWERLQRRRGQRETEKMENPK